MLAFIDESGDAGRKLDRGSSRFFVVAIVTFRTREEAQACDDAISRLAARLGRSHREFKFSKDRHSVRVEFLRVVRNFEFAYRAFVLNKDPTRLYGRGFDFKESLYKYVCGLALKDASRYLSDATVVIDRSGDRSFRRQLGTYLRRTVAAEHGSGVVTKVKTDDSRGNRLLQLADYMAGIVNREAQGKAGAAEYSALIAKQRDHVQIWPK